jgi:histidinol phosphatase-like PHP family hydrolase
LGVEQTILSDKGRIGIRSSGINHLNYIILAVHWMSIGGRLGRKELYPIVKNPEKMKKLIKTAQNFYKNALENPRLTTIPKIIGHPLNFLHKLNLSPEVVIDACDLVCQYCSENNAAIELNIDLLPPKKELIDKETHSDYYSQFYTGFFKSINDHKTLVSLGSDAHRLENIGKIEPLTHLGEIYGLNSNLFLNENFFKV